MLGQKLQSTSNHSPDTSFVSNPWNEWSWLTEPFTKALALSSSTSSTKHHGCKTLSETGKYFMVVDVYFASIHYDEVSRWSGKQDSRVATESTFCWERIFRNRMGSFWFRLICDSSMIFSISTRNFKSSSLDCDCVPLLDARMEPSDILRSTCSSILVHPTSSHMAKFYTTQFSLHPPSRILLIWHGCRHLISIEPGRSGMERTACLPLSALPMRMATYPLPPFLCLPNQPNFSWIFLRLAITNVQASAHPSQHL